MLSFLGAAACGEAEWESPVPSTRYRNVQVQVGQASEEESTRSLVSIDIENFQKAALFAMDPETGTVLTYEENAGDRAGEPVAVLTDRPTFSWALPVDVAMDIYTLVNYGDMDLEPYFKKGLNRSELEELVFTSKSPSELRQLETSGQGLPMAGIEKNVRLAASGDGLTVHVKKLYAKYNIYFDLSRIEAEGWHVQAMHMIVENANTEVPYFRENFRQGDASKLVEYDRATESDLDLLQQGGSGHAVTLYMLENCQGTKEGAESWKTVYKDLGFEALGNCTYIDLSVKIQRGNGEYQNLGYAIYLGKTDMRTDFDIVRNLFKTIKIVLPGPSDPFPASHFFRFSGTASPTIAPGETLDLYFVTDLNEEDIAVTLAPEGILTLVGITYEAGADGIATGSVRVRAHAAATEGSTCLVTAGSEALHATDQKSVTVDTPVVLDAVTTAAPAYVAQQGVVELIPNGTVARTEAAIKPGSEGILSLLPSTGSPFKVGVAALSEGEGTLVLHHFDSDGNEIGHQEVTLTVRAPLLRFDAATYPLCPDGSALSGTLSYVQEDGTAFSDAQKASFDLALVRTLLFPERTLPLDEDSPFAEAAFTSTTEADYRNLSLPFQVRLVRIQADGKELDWSGGSLVDRMRYTPASGTGILPASADLLLSNPFEALSGKSLGVIENNLPLYWAFQEISTLLKSQGVQAEEALSITSYREGSTFSVNGNTLSLEVELPIDIPFSVQMESPSEFTITCSGNTLTLTATSAPASYETVGRYPLYGKILHAETGVRSPALEMGYLEVYQIGAAGPSIRESGARSYTVSGTVIPAGSPVGTLLDGTLIFTENTDFTMQSVDKNGLYLALETTSRHLFYQAEDEDETGVQRTAAAGETDYLNAYDFQRGPFNAGEGFLEFTFGKIYMDNYHTHDLVTAAGECRRMTTTNTGRCTRQGMLYHFNEADLKDGNGLSYCAFVNTFGGNGFRQVDVFL